MRTIMICLATVCAFIAPAAAADHASLTNACDLAAANSTDRGRPADIPGLAFDKIDAKAAVAACEAAVAAAPANPRLLYQLGRSYRAMKDFDKARTSFEKAAAAGYAAARYELGTLYEAGVGGLPKDGNEAVRLMELAVAQGDPAAQSHLGILYAQGRDGLPRDDHKALLLLKLASTQGETNATTRLALFYATGRGGLVRNDQEAERLFKLAVAKGNVDAKNRLAVFQDKLAAERYYEGLGPGGKLDKTGIAMLIRLVRRQFYQCWHPPSGARDVNVVIVRMTLNKDGTLAGEPRVVSVGGNGPVAQAAAESALRAVRTCVPLMLPADEYDLWQEVEASFDPRRISSDSRRTSK